MVVVIVVVGVAFAMYRLAKKRATYRTEKSSGQQQQSGEILGSQGIANPLYNNAAFGADIPSYEDFQEPAGPVDTRTSFDSTA